MEGVHVWMGATGCQESLSGERSFELRPHLVLAWEQPGMLEEQEEGQSGWSMCREGWNSAKGGQEGKRGRSHRALQAMGRSLDFM